MTAPYGLSIKNPSGDLVLSSEAFGLYYAGKATYSADVTWAPAVATDAEASWGAGSPYATYKKYTFTSSAACAFGITVDSTFVTTILEVTYSAGVYSIIVMRSSGTADLHGFKAQTAAEVYAFTRAASVSGAYGLVIYDATGAVAWDLTRQPLFLTQSVSFAVSVNSATMPGSFTKPAVVGTANAWLDGSVLINPSFGRYRLDGFMYGFKLSGANILRSSDCFRFGPTVDFGAGNLPSGIGGGNLATTVYLFEATGL